MIFNCEYCGNESEKPAGHYNRSKAIGAPVYCGRICAGLGRRSNKTIEERKKEKSEYDKEYAKRDVEAKRIKRHEYFKRTYDKEKAAIERKKKYPKHLEYLRTDEYRAWKKEYDVRHLAKKHFGEFAEAAIVLSTLEKELDSGKIKIEIGLINKSQKRKRQWQQLQK